MKWFSSKNSAWYRILIQSNENENFVFNIFMFIVQGLLRNQRRNMQSASFTKISIENDVIGVKHRNMARNWGESIIFVIYHRDDRLKQNEFQIRIHSAESTPFLISGISLIHVCDWFTDDLILSSQIIIILQPLLFVYIHSSMCVSLLYFIHFETAAHISWKYLL